mgnify:CR=1 FL=1
MTQVTVTTNLDIVDENDGVISLREAAAMVESADQDSEITFASNVDNVILTRGLEFNTLNERFMVIDGDHDGDGIGDVSISGNITGSLGVQFRARTGRMAKPLAPMAATAATARGRSGLRLSQAPSLFSLTASRSATTRSAPSPR